MNFDSPGYLFDSNIVIAILDKDQAAVDLVRQAQKEKRKIFFSTVTECGILSKFQRRGLRAVASCFYIIK